MAAKQIPLNLSSAPNYAAHYFVPHSGVADALHLAESALETMSQVPGGFQSLYIYGSPGSGKSHLCTVLAQRLDELNVSTEKRFFRDLVAPVPEGDMSELVAAYERCKSSGGVFCLSSRSAPTELSSNPHLLSRIQSGLVLEVFPPGIEELQPMMESLLERRNIRPRDHAIQYLLRRVPTNPLSLWDIFAKIDDRALSQGRPVNMTLIREILEEL